MVLDLVQPDPGGFACWRSKFCTFESSDKQEQAKMMVANGTK